MGDSEVRIGIIGSGGIAGAHAAGYRPLKGVRVVAVADVVPGRAKAFIEGQGLEGAEAFSDHREMLTRDLDAVSVCTFNAAHYQPTMDALAAGKHVLLEKPMATTLADGLAMVRQARASGRMLSIGFQSRYQPNAIAAHALAASGALGHIYYAETGGGRRRGIPGGTFVRRDTAVGGAVLDIGCYSLDTALWVMGNPRPLTVSATTSNHFGSSPERARLTSWDRRMDPAKFDVEDFGVATLTFSTGVVAALEVTWHGTPGASAGTRQFVGTRGQLVAGRTGDGGWLVAEEGATPGWQTAEAPTGGRTPLGHMLDHLLEGTPLAAGVNDALSNLRVCAAFYRAAAEGRAVSPADA